MESSVVAALIGVGFLTLCNIAAVAFSYGKLSQKVEDLSRRVNELNGRKQ